MAKLVWWGGEQVQGQRCEDAPCCGCCGQGSDDGDQYEAQDAAYQDERYEDEGQDYLDERDGDGDLDEEGF